MTVRANASLAKAGSTTALTATVLVTASVAPLLSVTVNMTVLSPAVP